MGITKLSICLVASLLLCNKVYSQKRDIHIAEQIAKEFLHSNGGSIVEVAPQLRSRSKSKGTEKAFYIFNDTKNPSFVIVSGDERMKTILGGCEGNIFDVNNIPCGLSYLLSHYSEQYDALDEIGKPNVASSTNTFYTSESEVAPLLTSKWGQDAPFNDNCPSGCPSGCIATAMSQIMYYYKYPDTGTGYFSYTTTTDKYKCTYNFSQANFDWTLLQDVYNEGHDSSQSRKAVANLLKACGVSVAMNYTIKGSGGNETSIPYALINFFKYNKNVVVYERDFYKTEEWYKIVLNELTNNRPILYCGTSPGSNGRDAGHAFILDGYRPSDGKFHVNWGWDGRYDSYYEIDALDPPNGYRFSTGQSMIARFCPMELGPHEDIFYAEDFSTNEKFDLDKTITVFITGIYNYSNSSSYFIPNTYFSGKIGIGLFDSEFKIIESLAEEETEELRAFHGYEKVSFKIKVPSKDLVQNKVYYVAPYAKSNTSNIVTRVRTIGGITDYYAISKEGEIEPSDDDIIEEKEILINEDFESGDISSDWEQEQISGNSNWSGRMIFMGNDNSSSPNAQSGDCYAYLNYNSGTIFADIRTITKLITPILYGDSEQKYAISLHCRKYSSNVGTKDVVSILIDRGCNNQWELVAEKTIDNKNMWIPLQIQYTTSGKYRLAIEGSIEYGSTLFIDNITVAKVESLTSIKKGGKGIVKENAFFSLSGQRTSKPTKGVFIIRQGESTYKKVFMR